MRKILLTLFLILFFTILKSQELVLKVFEVSGSSDILRLKKNSVVSVKTQFSNDSYTAGLLYLTQTDSIDFFIKKNQRVNNLKTIFLGRNGFYQIFLMSFNDKTGKYQLHNSEISLNLDLVVGYDSEPVIDLTSCDTFTKSTKSYLTLEIESESAFDYFNSFFSIDSSVVFLSLEPITVSSIETSVFDWLEVMEKSLLIIDKNKSTLDFYKYNTSLKKTIKTKWIREITDINYKILTDCNYKTTSDKLSFNFDKVDSGVVESSTGLTTSFKKIHSQSKQKKLTTDLSKYFTDFESPEINLIEPRLLRDLKIVSKSKDINVKGIVTDKNQVIYLTVNDQEVTLNNGEFSKKIQATGNMTTITILAIDEFGNQTLREFVVEVPEPAVVTQPEEVVEEGLDNIGNYFALIISINSYQDKGIPQLDNPIKDGRTLKNTLIQKYTFESNNVVAIENATRKSIFKALSEMKSIIGKNDNLLIFYAGHGFFDKEMNSGYWLPSDSEKDNKADWISFDDVLNHIRAIQSKHTLVISDACFSGGFLKERSLGLTDKAMHDLYQVPSRKVITSGNLTTVPDESIFMKYLIKTLNENTNEYFTEEMLFDKIKIPVLNNSDTTPLIGTLSKTGDEGGNFIFIKR